MNPQDTIAFLKTELQEAESETEEYRKLWVKEKLDRLELQEEILELKKQNKNLQRHNLNLSILLKNRD